MPNRLHNLSATFFATAVFGTLLSAVACDAQSMMSANQQSGGQRTSPQLPSIEGSAEIPKDATAVLAVVGTTPVLVGDILPKVEAKIAEVQKKVGQEMPADQLKYARVNLTRGMLSQLIQQKMLREAFLLDQVATQTAEKRREAADLMNQRARAMFAESEIPRLHKKFETNDNTELDDKLRTLGSSLSARQREFIDEMLGHLYIRSKVEKNPSVTISEISLAYAADVTKYKRQARARWEQMSVLFSNHPSRDAAQAAISAMGREAYFGGSMKAVAKAKSEDPFASDGGQHDWTNRGSLKSKIIEKQVFSLPLNKMSEIFSDDEGLHIIRVLERQPDGTIPLAEVQDDIRELLKREKINESQKAVFKEVAERVQVWSLYPKDVPGAKPLPVRTTRRSITQNLNR